MAMAVQPAAALCAPPRPAGGLCASALHGAGAGGLAGTRLAVTASRSPASPRRRHAARAVFGLGIAEVLVIGGVATVLFGPKKLPEIGKRLGKTVNSFQQAAKEFTNEVKIKAEDATRELKELPKAEDKEQP
eukprot:SM000008S22290  [mRNA]  locus=s8:899062:899733:+ [translate_table: standard]